MSTPDFIVEVEVTVRTGFGYTHTIFRGLNSKARQIFDPILQNPGQAEIVAALDAKGLGNQDWNSEEIRTELKFQNSSMLRTFALTGIGTRSRLRFVPIPSFDPFLNQPIPALFSKKTDAVEDWRKARKKIDKFVPLDQLDEALSALTTTTNEIAKISADEDLMAHGVPLAVDMRDINAPVHGRKIPEMTPRSIPILEYPPAAIHQTCGATQKPQRSQGTEPKISAISRGCKNASRAKVKLISSDISQLLKSYFHEKNSMDQIAEHYGRSKGTVCKYVNLAKAVMASEGTDILSDATISKICGDISNFVLPDFVAVHVVISAGATRDACWKNYVQANPGRHTYSRSTFFEKYAEWIAENARRGTDDPDPSGLTGSGSD